MIIWFRLYVCLYVCMSVCLYVTKINFVNFFKIGAYNFFNTLHDERGHQMVKVPCRLMHWLPLFGPNDVIFLPQNRYFVNFLENCAYVFFLYFA